MLKITSSQKADLQSLLVEHETIFDGSICDWDTDQVSL